jgi:hypothetical protein
MIGWIMAKNDGPHKEAINDLARMVRDNYAIMVTEVPVRDPVSGDIVGEIDLLGIIDRTWDLYEVKSNENYRKAEKQLKNLKDYLEGYADINLYYYSGKGGKILKVD